MVSLDVEGKSHLLLLCQTGEAALWDGQQWKKILIPSEANARCLAGAASSVTHDFWLTTHRSLYRIDPRTGIAERQLAFDEGSPAYGIGVDVARKSLWLIGPTWAGCMRLQPSNGASKRIDILNENLDLHVALRLDPHLDVQDDGRGGVWFGNNFTVMHLTGPGRLKKMSEINGLAAEGETCLFKDREQNLWIMSPRGMTKVIHQRFANYDHEQGLLHDEVTAVCELRDGTMVLGHPGGLSILGAKGIETVPIEGTSPRSRVMDLSVGPNGHAWVACDYVGVGRLERKERGSDPAWSIHWLPNSLHRRAISICPDREGILWVGTAEGLYQIQDDKVIPLSIPALDGLENRGVRRIVKATDGSMLLATMTKGIMGIREGRSLPWSTQRTNRNTFTVLEDSQGRIWGGSKQGLLILREKHFEYSEAPRLRQTIYDLLEDADHRLWIGTDNGVYVWNGKGLQYFNVSKGLVGTEINRAALFEDSHRRIWIGTDRGVSRYNPSLDTRVAMKPIVSLKYAEVEGARHDLHHPLSLPAASNDLTFQFSVSSFIDEDGVLFQTKLENFDDKWSDWRKLPLRIVRYTNLPAGEYRFHVRARDVEGNESDAALSARIHIELPFYAQTWFLVLNGLFLLVLIWAGFQFFAQRRYAHDLETQIRLHTEKLQKAERTQAQIARLESLGALAGGIAHDFNNLLTAITGYNSLIAETSHLDSEASGFVQEIQKACARAQALTRQLLTFSSGGTPVREITSIQDIIRDACGFALMGSTLECRLDLPDDLPAVNVDSGQFHQVFNNLILNARQAMPGGGVLRISARVLAGEDKDNPQIQIEVTDEGRGIPADVLGQIFDPYFTTKEEGSGLGLAIVHSIVTKHGGTVSAENNVQHGAPTGVTQGSTFRITIPAAVGRPKPASLPQESSTLEPCRILIMDDQDAIRTFVRTALQHQGCEVAEADEGETAIAAYEAALKAERPFCAVIMDLTIPGGMGGLEASRTILSIDPQAQLVVTSGYANEPILADYESFGFVGRLGKPFSVNELIQVLTRIQQKAGARMSAD